jgi:phenylalanyl-tRNA synthetase alpha chain
MSITFTETQLNRLLELGADQSDSDVKFENNQERDQNFREEEKILIASSKINIQSLLKEKHRPETAVIANELINWLTDDEGFTQVFTPTVIPVTMLDKMTLTEDEPLREQVFYVERNRCLRPMLAPNLYVLMRELRRITKETVRIFEIGSCFRKESQGAKHLSEFTMLNMVEIGTKEGTQLERLEQLAHGAMKAIHAEGYELTRETSTVYGETIDIEWKGTEVASCSYGPHALDPAWDVFDTWVGLGLGIERLAMLKTNANTIQPVGRSINYIDGTTLGI